MSLVGGDTNRPTRGDFPLRATESVAKPPELSLDEIARAVAHTVDILAKGGQVKQGSHAPDSFELSSDAETVLRGLGLSPSTLENT